MLFETAFNYGDKAWAYYGWQSEGVQQVTVGQIRIEYTDTLVDEDEETGYAELVQGYKEVYMCKETGINSGSLLTLGEHIFKTEAECEAAFSDKIALRVQEKVLEVMRKRNETLIKEKMLRMQLAEIEKLKLEK